MPETEVGQDLDHREAGADGERRPTPPKAEAVRRDDRSDGSDRNEGNSHRPIQVASNSCTGTNSSCTATCAAGVIKTAWGFHGGNGANTDFGFAQNTCGSFVQWKGSCIGQSSCTVSTGCNASSIILECW